MLLGLLVFEMATSKQAFQDIYPLSTVALAVLHGKVQLNVEADHFLQKQGKEVSSGAHYRYSNPHPILQMFRVSFSLLHYS